MAVPVTSLPKYIQEKIEKIGVEVSKVVVKFYSTRAEVHVFWTDPKGRTSLKIFGVDSLPSIRIA